MSIKRTIFGLVAALAAGLGVAVICVAAYVALLSWAWTASDIPHKSDAELIANFKTHEAEFNQLLQMVMTDNCLYRVDDNWTNPDDPKTIGISDERIAAYRKMFRALDIPRGFSANQDVGVVESISSAQGLSISGSSKSYVWLKEPPSDLVDDIDTYRTKPGASYPVYRDITGNWYLEYDAD